MVDASLGLRACVHRMPPQLIGLDERCMPPVSRFPVSAPGDVGIHHPALDGEVPFSQVLAGRPSVGRGPADAERLQTRTQGDGLGHRSRNGMGHLSCAPDAGPGTMVGLAAGLPSRWRAAQATGYARADDPAMARRGDARGAEPRCRPRGWHGRADVRPLAPPAGAVMMGQHAPPRRSTRGSPPGGPAPGRASRGAPRQNGARARFSGQFRAECVKRQWGLKRREAPVIIERSRRPGNAGRPPAAWRTGRQPRPALADSCPPRPRARRSMIIHHSPQA